MHVTQTIEAEEVNHAITRLVEEIARAHGETPKFGMIGIARGGVPLGRVLTGLLSKTLNRPVSFGVIDISFHRDDIGKNPIPTHSRPTEIPFDIEGSTVLLVDDVLFSGRTVRAATNELFDLGRPSKVELAVLVDRGGRRLPIAPDYTGLTVKIPDTGKVKVLIHADSPGEHRIQLFAPNT